MDEFTRDLAAGEAGLHKIDAAMGGDLGAASQYAAIEELLQQPQPVRSYRGPGSSFRFRGWVGVVCAVILIALVLIH